MAKSKKQAGVDPITMEIIRNKFTQIVEEMSITLKHVSVSPVITEVNDIQTMLLLSDGTIAIQGVHCVMPGSNSQFVVRNVLERCSDNPGICEGDQFLMNDPYLLGAHHQPDFSIVKPIFYEGELLMWSYVMAHMLDIGSMVAGGMTPKAHDVYQEGLRMPPVKIVENNEIRKDVFEFILNMIRVKDVELDVKGQIAANNVAEQRVHELLGRYDKPAILSTIDHVINQSEQMFRERLREFPDGTYRARDFIDYDGHRNKLYTINLAMTKKDDRLIFDLTGTSEQAEGYINCCPGGVLGNIMLAIAMWIAYDIPINQGMFKPLELINPEGTICHPTLPHPCSGGGIKTGWQVHNCADICLSKMASCTEKYRGEAMGVWEGCNTFTAIQGINQYGGMYGYVIMDHIAGGGGARWNMDGLGSGGDPNSASLCIPTVETHEASYPMLILFRKEAPDTDGAGTFRGGFPLEEAYIPHDTDRIFYSISNYGVEVSNAIGVFGGYPGCRAVSTICREAGIKDFLKAGNIPTSLTEIPGKKEELPPVCQYEPLEAGDVMHHVYGGGGGLGDPLDRDPQMVLADVRDRMMSIRRARDIYRVEIDEKKMTVDASMTDKLRKDARKKRLGG